MQLFAVVQKGLETIARDELREAGVTHCTAQPGGFAFPGHLSTLYRLHLRLRVVSRLLVQVAQFPARGFRDLQDALAAADWAPFLSNQRLRLHVQCFRSQLWHEDAVAERALAVLPHNDAAPLEQRLYITIRENEVRVSVDASGDHLHKRGWAAWRAAAPLRETVAAAMLRAADWHTGGALLADPFCGGGTIALEACAMRLGLSPHGWRGFAFQQWPSHREDLWRKAIEALPQVQPEPFQVLASDIDPEALAALWHNAQGMGVQAHLEAMCAPFAVFHPQPGTLVVTNPPWGGRLRRMPHDAARLRALVSQGVRVVALLPAEAAQNAGGEVLLRTRAGNIEVAAICWGAGQREGVAPVS